MASGLRELNKQRTRAAIQEAAVALIAEQGFAGTTCEQIAARAKVSPATFFRYFPSKEDVILRDDYDPLMAEAIRSRPSREGPLLAVRRGLLSAIGHLDESEMEVVRARTALILGEPSLRGRIQEEQMRTGRDALAGALADRLDRRLDDLEVQAVAAATTAALAVAVEHWAGHGGRLVEHVDRALQAISAGPGTAWPR